MYPLPATPWHKLYPLRNIPLSQVTSPHSRAATLYFSWPKTWYAREKSWTAPGAPWHHWTNLSELLPMDEARLVEGCRLCSRKSTVGLTREFNSGSDKNSRAWNCMQVSINGVTKTEKKSDEMEFLLLHCPARIYPAINLRRKYYSYTSLKHFSQRMARNMLLPQKLFYVLFWMHFLKLDSNKCFQMPFWIDVPKYCFLECSWNKNFELCVAR